jgi:hypothetical protein
MIGPKAGLDTHYQKPKNYQTIKNNSMGAKLYRTQKLWADLVKKSEI